jgi:hypothetical protein
MDPSSKVKISKREKSKLKLSDNLSLWGEEFVHHLLFKEARYFGSWLCFRFPAKKYLTWRTLRLSCSQPLQTTDTDLTYTLENKCSPCIVTGKWPLEN